MPRHHMILSPHFDDAVLSLGGLLAKAPSDCTVVTIFGGAPKNSTWGFWDWFSGFTGSEAATKNRERENIEALQQLGVPKENIVTLTYVDAQYRTTSPSAERMLLDSLVSDILPLFDSHKHDDIALYAPGLEMHRDHRLVKHALLEVQQQLRTAGIHFYLYQDLPYSYTPISRGLKNA